ncbi:hypothetical protein PK98_11105 [Croceibacterium mercuriale]|uniref:DUF2793 domain-containing protein n=1 Tax=Croceibacterium mercuriale TaxID=1572751 RepID=A0A0B2BXE4_9SPHN|nr:DUF2793 domain-containing protein [Croceibacterium mercuriale]KHL24535.1 hypothetical protein PK98_11105 [Croceibacterium mercuriale]
MSDLLNFAATSARHGLPLIFPGQVQKEFFVNEAHALVDALLHPVVLGTATSPPAEAADGDCWIVGAEPGSAWAGQTDMLACRQAGTWLFAAPCDGLRVHDRTSGADLRYCDGRWRGAATVRAPQGGEVVDSEARKAVGQLITALTDAGLLPRAGQAA